MVSFRKVLCGSLTLTHEALFLIPFLFNCPRCIVVLQNPAGICKVSLAGGWGMWYNILSYAPVAKLVYAMDLGDVTSVKVFRPIIRRAHSLVKTGSSCFYRCGSSVMLRLGSLAV